MLILGSLPGRRSLEAGQYYAHPQNGFWPIMSALAGATGSYPERCAALLNRRIAVWDVLADSVRPGSLDADIRTASASANDFQQFFAAHRAIRLVAFNGQKAAELYRRLVLPALPDVAHRHLTLPSTSPAYASMTIDDKLSRWRHALADTEEQR